MKTIDVRKPDEVVKDTIQVIFGQREEHLLHYTFNDYFSIIDEDNDEILIYVEDITKMIEALSALRDYIQQETPL